MRIPQLFLSLACSGLVSLLPAWSQGQDYPYQSDAPAHGYYVSAANLESMLRRIEALEASSAQPAAAPKEEWIDVSEEKLTIKVGGRVHMDYVTWGDDDEFVTAAPAINTRDYVEMRRLRIHVEGEGFGVYEYKVEVDFEPSASARNTADTGSTTFGTVAMKDVFVGIKEMPIFGHVRLGHFKAPFSLEQLTSSRFISFIERSTSDNVFVPGRELGIAAYRVSPDQNWTLGYGAFFNDISETTKERNDSNMGFLAAARVSWTPYYDEPSNGRYLTHLGAGATYTDVPGNSKSYSSRPGTHLGDAFINTGTLAISEQTVVNGEFAWVNGPLSLQAEVFACNADRADIAGTDDFYGAYIFASYFLTGEHRTYRRSNGIFDRVVPHSNFWWVNGCAGPGAWEALIRWSVLDFTDNPGVTATSFTGQMNDVTLGFNWYWNPNMKMMFNFSKIYTDGGAFNGLEGDWFGVSTRFDF